MTDADDRHFDAVTDLSRLSDRQLLERMVRNQQRMEMMMSAASDYMTAALSSLDVQMQNLQTRMSADAAALKAAVDAAASGQADTAALVAAADRVQQTAELVASLDQPSVVADPESPVEATPVDPEPAPADPAPVEDPAPVDGGSSDQA